MQIPIDQFEHFIDETILKRGLAYFKNGLVHDHEEISIGEYSAIVEASEDYTVKLNINNKIITEHFCDCPYDMGPVCKHVAALIFYLQQDELKLNKKTKKSKSEKAPKPAKRKTFAEQVEEILENATHEELKDFLREKTGDSPVLRNLFLSSFAQHNSDESKELYAQQVKSILKTASDKHGFIPWSAGRLVCNAVGALLDSAEKQIDNHNYKSAFFICTAVMEQMTKALQFADDSSGSIGGSIDFAYETLCAMAKEQISEEIRALIINYCFFAFDKQLYAGWDWHIEILQLASTLLKTDEEIARIFAQIDNTKWSDYEIGRIQSLRYEIILKTKGESAANEYIEQNISNYKLRREAIKIALEKNDYEKAISLATDGINSDKDAKPGLIKEWYDWLLKVAQAQNHTDKIIEYSRLLFVDNSRNEQDYYQLLKQNIEPEKWTAFVEDIIQDINAKQRFYDSGLIATIFIKEEWWDRLLELLQKSPSLYTIDAYESYLSKNYRDEIIELYADGVKTFLKNNVGRNHYKSACRYIRKIVKLGAREKAIELIAFLKAEYRQRKALIEELGKIQ